MKSLKIFVSLLVFSITAFAQDTLWTRTYGGGYDDYGYSVQECSSGGFIIAGKTESYGAGGSDVWLIRTDANGNPLWTKHYGGTNDDWGSSVQECSSGGFIITGVTGAIYGPTGGDVYLIRTDALGDTLWTKTYGGDSTDYGSSVQECSDGGFIITGATKSFGSGGYDVYLIRTDSLGDTLWTRTYGGDSTDYGSSVQECASGGFIITGKTESFDGGGVCLIRTDSLGDTLWTRTYGTVDDYGCSVKECSSGGFIIAGTIWSYEGDAYDVCLIRTDSLGDTLWRKTYGGFSEQFGNSVWECSSGGFIIVGTDRGYGELDVYLIRTDSLGNTLWTKHYGGTNDDWGSSVQECSSGGFIITGYTMSYGAGGADVYLIRTNLGVELLSPNGGESLVGGSIHNITWSWYDSAYVDHYRLLFSTDGGTTYPDTIAYSIPNTNTSYPWTLPSIVSTTCRVEVQILDSLDNVISEDESDNNFSIVEAGVEERTSNIPKTFSISQNPNPFTRYTVLNYQIPVRSKVSLRIYDLTGRLVKKLVDGEKNAGYYTVRWNAGGIKSGIYFVRFKTNNYEKTKKMVLMR